MKKLGLIACVSLFLSACATGPAVDLSAKCIMNPDEDASRSVTFEGTKVGFCCKKCEGAFAKKTDEEKRAAIAKISN